MPITSNKSHFSSVTALRKFTPSVLVDFLNSFPAYLKRRKLSFPDRHQATAKNMPYDDICKACMAQDIDPDLNRLLFMATKLGDAAGCERIEGEMEFRGLKPSADLRTKSYSDIPLLVWLQRTPDYPDILEQSYASLNIHSKSAYRYYAPTRDCRNKFKPITKAGHESLRAELARHFTGDSENQQVKVIDYDFEHEVWFMIRYPGHPIRPDAMTATGEDDDASYTPGQYDAVVYHKAYGDLRLNTVRHKDHTRYRVTFGHTLVGEPNVFSPDRQLVTLKPLHGECLYLFPERGPFPRVRPVEICFFDLQSPGRRITWRAAEKDGDLLRYPSVEKHAYLLPDSVDTIQHAKFRYKLSEDDAWHNLTIHQGMDMRYERDGDSMILETWLRDRGFILNAFAK